jgi:hypothetical protein
MFILVLKVKLYLMFICLCLDKFSGNEENTTRLDHI